MLILVLRSICGSRSQRPVAPNASRAIRVVAVAIVADPAGAVETSRLHGEAIRVVLVVAAIQAVEADIPVRVEEAGVVAAVIRPPVVEAEEGAALHRSAVVVEGAESMATVAGVTVEDTVAKRRLLHPDS